MKFKSVILLAVAAGCGLVAMMGVQQALSNDAADENGKTKVLVAVADINAGSRLNETNTEFREWSGTIPAGVVTKPEEIEDRVITTRAVPGEPIMLAKLGEKGAHGPTVDIPKGMRVATVSVNATDTHSGMIRPGNRVDVLVTFRSNSPNGGAVTKTRTILEYIKVFASDSTRDPYATEGKAVAAKNISLLLTPEQVPLLMLAKTRGQALHLSLRSQGDDETGGKNFIVTENQLDNVRIGVGEDDPETGEPGNSLDDEPGNPDDPRDFVKNIETQDDEELIPPDDTVVEPVVEEPVLVEIEPEPPKWTIVIFAGGERREELVDLPVTEIQDEQQLQQPEATGSLWKGWLNKFLIGS